MIFSPLNLSHSEKSLIHVILGGGGGAKKQFQPLLYVTNKKWTKAVTTYTPRMTLSTSAFKSDSCFPSRHTARMLLLLPSNHTHQMVILLWFGFQCTWQSEIRQVPSCWHNVPQLLVSGSCQCPELFLPEAGLEISEFWGQRISLVYLWQCSHQLSHD